MADDHSAIIDIGEKDLNQAIKEHPRLIVDCWAPWCPDCHALEQVYSMLAAEYSGKITFAKIQLDLNPAVKETYQIRAVPTLLLFRNGRLIHRLVEPSPKKAALQHEIDRTLT